MTINTGLSATNTVVTTPPAAAPSIGRRRCAPPTRPRSATLRGMLDNPAGYYVNLHTTVNPGGVIRGQLQRAEGAVFIGLMSPCQRSSGHRTSTPPASPPSR